MTRRHPAFNYSIGCQRFRGVYGNSCYLNHKLNEITAASSVYIE